MKIYDTLSQKIKEFYPLEDNKVKMYVCGPTVYDYPHLGHARCYITWDVVSRYLRFKGYDVTYVRNITDVDDKIINRARENNITPQELADTYYKEFQKAMKALNVAPPDIEPKATETIQDMITIIKKLEEKGYAYESDGDMYFRVSKFKKYGRLGKQSIDDLQSGARVEASDKKENPLDFALWKAINNKEEISWDSPWGKGRPGWHIECSAMSKKYLGEQIDIHAGGQDLIFPHHENEKAQSEATFDKDFVKYWMHNGFVTTNKEKMSKSLGNFLTINDLLEKYDANTIRFFILTNHYRMPVEFSDESLKAAKNGIKRLKNAYEDVKNTVDEEKIKEANELITPIIDAIVKTDHLPFYEIDSNQDIEKTIPSENLDNIIKNIKNFVNAMDDDFNTSKALSVLFEVASNAQKIRESQKPQNSAFCLALLLRLSSILGFDLTKSENLSDDLSSQLMELVISLRQKSREEKNWVMSDFIRDELAKLNIVLKDQKDKPTIWSIQD
ncbi:MAG: cysteine--tRNA ligase [bacterium]